MARTAKNQIKAILFKVVCGIVSIKDDFIGIIDTRGLEKAIKGRKCTSPESVPKHHPHQVTARPHGRCREQPGTCLRRVNEDANVRALGRAARAQHAHFNKKRAHARRSRVSLRVRTACMLLR